MKNLVVVESPSKTKKLGSFLGKDYEVISSVGHIRDLPKSGLAVDVENNFTPQYVVNEDKDKVVKELRKKAKDAEVIYLATDPDREGESIAWHVGYVMNNENELEDEKNKNYLLASSIVSKNSRSRKVPVVYRVTFNSITKDSVVEAFKNPRKLDTNLINAQQARRVLDRLVGYKLSPLLWEKIRYGLSAGRVQSAAVRLVVEREREIEKFPKDPYFEFAGEFSTIEGKKEKLNAILKSIDEKSIYVKEKFSLFTGPYEVSKTLIDTEKKAEEISAILKSCDFKIASNDQKEVKSHPSPPFMTSSLQQSASSKLGYSPSRTMQFAQKLYEAGYITYMRTDSVHIIPEFVTSTRNYISKEFGKNYLNSTERYYKSKKGLKTQEAHEGIRPTDINTRPESLPKSVNPQQRKLYELIWTRTLATQMSPAVFLSTKIVIQNEQKNTKDQKSAGSPLYSFEAKGSVIKFDGYLKVYSNKRKEEILPQLSLNQNLKLNNLNTESKLLTPPPRYNESSLVRELEKFNIGRPSTYASIISTIQTRGYVKKDEKTLSPTDNGFVVNDLLVKHFPDIVDMDFTAQMENDLDEIALGKLEWTSVIRDFYSPFEKTIEQKKKEIKKEDIVNLEKTDEVCPECKKGHLMIKLGKYGKFLSCDQYPDCKFAKPIEQPDSPDGETNDQNGNGNQELSEEYKKILEKNCPECSGKLKLKTGRFGQFIACENYPKCKYTLTVQNKLDIKCLECGDQNGGQIVIKRTKRGKIFYGCSRYPSCKYASWTKPTATGTTKRSATKAKAKTKK